LKAFNPYYNYYYTLQSSNGLNYTVVFTDGVNVITPKPNMTVTSYSDGSAIYTDSQGNKAFYPANFLYPTSNSTVTTFMPLNGFSNVFSSYNSYSGMNMPSLLKSQNVTETFSTVSGCQKIDLKYTDFRAAPSSYLICSNGTYRNTPSVWTNFTYFDYSSQSSYPILADQ